MILTLLDPGDKYLQSSRLDVCQSECAANEGPCKTDESFPFVYVFWKFLIERKEVRAACVFKLERIT